MTVNSSDEKMIKQGRIYWYISLDNKHRDNFWIAHQLPHVYRHLDIFDRVSSSEVVEEDKKRMLLLRTETGGTIILPIKTLKRFLERV